MEQSLPDSLRLVLHPGHPKCGSSTIQFGIYSHVDLLQKQGFFVPNRRFEFATDGRAFHERLGNPVRYLNEVTDPDSLAVLEERLARAIESIRQAGGSTVLISAENLGNKPGVNKLRPVHRVLARHFTDVHVIFYIRRQDEWMVSSWQQWGHKLGWSFARYVEESFAAHRPDFLQSARFFEDNYEQLKLEVVPLNRQVLIGHDLLADFSERAGLGPLELTDEDQFRNASFGGALCDVLSRIHEIYSGTDDRKVRKLLAEFPASRGLIFSRDKRALTPELRRRILAHFRADNEALHETYFPQVPFDTVFGLPDGEDDGELEILRARVDGLTDVVAIQMDMILSLLENADGPEASRSLLGRLARRSRSGDEAGTPHD